ncbi:hypothetical protein PG994_013437 [Apiospora phragmitis]|uniref:Uncharacterized protein n=1 Tax=Apiospora phragmitis TaxID=2905665 RepID=A0ABR1T8N1_9PEZI
MSNLFKKGKGKDKDKGKSKSDGSVLGLATPINRTEYREYLEENKIYFREYDEPVPKYVTDVCDDMRKPRTSPEPTRDDALRHMNQLIRMQHNGAQESQVEDWFKTKVFPDADGIAERRLQGLEVRAKPTFQNCIPNGSGSSPQRISKPIPDLVYGYSTDRRRAPFSSAQKIAGGRWIPGWG